MKVFVYGTLKAGRSNHRLLATATFVGQGATVKSFRMGDCGFPVLLESKKDRLGCARVQGEVYEVDDATIERLDALEAEGRMYRREVHKIELASGRRVKAFVYIGTAAAWKRRLDLFAVGNDGHHNFVNPDPYR
jgi:gamma-glutamylaminecyclotransferase